MFSAKLYEIEPFVTIAGNEVMKNIQASSAFDDNSLLATLRALLFERLHGQNFNAYVRDAWTTGGDNVTNKLKNIFGDHKSNTLVFAHTTDESKFNNAAKVLEQKELDKDKNFKLTYQKEVSEGIQAKSKLDCRVCINEDNNIAFVLVRNLDIRTLRLLSTLQTRYFPKLFKDNPILPDEMTLLKSLTNRSAEDYKNALAAIGKRMNLRPIFLKILVGNFEKRETERMIRSAEEKVHSLRNEIDRMMNAYSDAVRRHQNEMFRIEGMRASIANKGEDSELLTYLSDSKNIDLLKIDGSNFQIVIRTFCDIFDQATWNRYASRGDIFKDYRSDIACFNNPDNIKKLMNAIFNENPVVRLKFCGYYSMNLSGNVTSGSHRNYGPDYKDYMPNPHLNYHNCLGGNAPQISKQLTDGNMIGALECAMASCKSINLSETTQTLRPMIRDIINSTTKIIHTDDGDMTPEEALNWLIAREKENKK